MNLGRSGLLLVGLGLVAIVGCASHTRFPESSLTGGLFEVKIDESLTPSVVTAKRGDEVKWVNMSSGPVDISLVQTREEVISCQKGFASADGFLFGQSQYETIVVATVLPNDAANLCFAVPGKYPYTIRWHPPIAGHPITITGSVTIE